MSTSRILKWAFLSIVCCPLVFTHTSWAAPKPGWTRYDIWTYIKNLEDKKAFTTLSDFLEELKKTHDANDIEGLAYLYDDLAEVYAKGSINFDNAQAYNNSALALCNKIVETGITSIPFSPYFTPRRDLYYYFYPLNHDYNSNTRRQLRTNSGEVLFYNISDLATTYPLDFLNEIRNSDFQNLFQRVKERELYIGTKLGLTEEKSERHKSTTIDQALIDELVDSVPGYNSYYKNYFIANNLWHLHRNGTKIDYNRLQRLCIDALHVEQQQRSSHDNDSHNLFLYWSSLASLELGDYEGGVTASRQLFRELHKMDDLEVASAKKRKKVIGQAIEEKQKRGEHIAIAISLIGMAASMGVAVGGTVAAWNTVANKTFTSVQGANAALQSAQNTLLQSAIISGCLSSGSVLLSATSSNLANRDLSLNRTALSDLLGELVLKLGRYLNQFDQVDLYVTLAEAYIHLGDKKNAIRYYKEAIRLIEIQRSTVSAESTRMSFFAIKGKLYDNMIDLLFTEGQYTDAFEYAERARSRAFLDSLGSKGKITLKNPEHTNQFSSAMTRKSEISALLDQTNWGAQQVEFLSRTAIGPHQSPSLDVELLSQMTTISAKEALSFTTGDTSVIEYFITEGSLYIFLLDKGTLSVKRVPISKKELFASIMAYRRTVSTSQASLKEMQDCSNGLYQILILPIINYITGSRLYIVPHMWLNYIPFGALYNDGRYLIEAFPLSSIPSMSVLTVSIKQKSFDKDISVLIFANPQLLSSKYPNLKYAEEEGRDIAGSIDRSSLLTGIQASETNFRSMAPTYNNIHLAAHAYFDRDNPFASSIFLSRDGVNDGRLSVDKIYQLDLKHGLVVLSACETGLSFVSSGDELIGFSRAFLYAGSSAIVSTLWSVDDVSTCYLMKAFYAHRKSSDIDIALQKAQVDTIAKFHHPYYWAPVVLTGCNH